MRYIRQKQKWAEDLGITFELKQLPENIGETKLLELIQAWNSESHIDGYIIQLPLPKDIDAQNIINAISPEKDVDGFHPENQGKMLIGDPSGFVPCTPAGIMKIFESLEVNLEGKNIVIIGKSNIVGKPIMGLLVNAGATVTSCNSKTPSIRAYTSNADIIISAAGKPGLLKLDMIKIDSIIIDVGFTVVDDRIYGDADFDNINIAGPKITPVPGGVGALTVAMLMENTLKAYKKNRK